ncbi:MAG: asparagine synthase (glutamine-hydrolyzing) [bacterium]
MCGICGVFNFDPDRGVDPNLLRRMTAVLHHRGPDDEGYYINGNIGLGHKRLSIIDLSGGHQPMSNEDDTVWIAYNGELYNYLELKDVLIKRGHRFKTRSDTEVIIHAYEEWGEGCVERFNGMFAFAVWDDGVKKLFIARDHLGIKPLYYARIGERLLFASEIKSILQDPTVPRVVDREAVAEYFTFQNLLDDKTFFDSIKILPAGHILSCSGEGLRIQRYWDIEFVEDEDGPEEMYIEGFLEIFEDSVRRQMLTSDVPVATYSSGGMDSGSITLIASKVVGGRVKSFTCGFEEDEEYDERRYADIIAAEAGTEHHDFTPKVEEFVEIFPDLVWHLDEPRVGSSYPPYFVARLASQHVKVILAGQGGDELFAGYPRHLSCSKLWDEDEFRRKCYESFIYLFLDEPRRRLFSPDFVESVREYSPYESFLSILRATNARHPLNRVLYVDLKTYLHGLLVVEDKISMAHSLETRVPFLDIRLVEFANRIPPKYKLKGDTLKYITRTAMGRFLPPAITKRPKMGFWAPDAYWFKGDMRDMVYELLLGFRARGRGYFDYDFIGQIVDRHMKSERNYSCRIWSLLNFELWHRLFIDADP